MFASHPDLASMLEWTTLDKAHCSLRCACCGHSAGIKDSTVLKMAVAIQTHHLRKLSGASEAVLVAFHALAPEPTTKPTSTATTKPTSTATQPLASTATTKPPSTATTKPTSTATTKPTSTVTQPLASTAIKKTISKGSCVKASMPVRPHYLNRGESIDINDTKADGETALQKANKYFKNLRRCPWPPPKTFMLDD